MMPITSQQTLCEVCRQMHLCRRLRKAKRAGDSVIYVYAWLCERHAYIEML